MREWKDFSANYCQYCWAENISPTSFDSAWDAQLYDVLHLDAAWLYSSRYSFIVSKTIKCIFLHTLVPKCKSELCISSFSSSAMSTVMLRPALTCWARVTYWKYQRGTPPAATKEHLINRWLIFFVFQTKKCIFFPRWKIAITTLSLGGQQISVWKVKISYLLPLSMQSSLNSRHFRIHISVSLASY